MGMEGGEKYVRKEMLGATVVCTDGGVYGGGTRV